MLALEAGYRDPPSPAETKTVQGLRGGASVLMVAAFEEFIRAAVREHLAGLARDPPKKRLPDLPERLQVASIFESVQGAMRGPLHGAAGTKASRIPQVERAAELIVKKIVDVEAVAVSGGANCNSVAVKQVMGNVGLENVFSRLTPNFQDVWGPTSSRYVSDKLDEIVQRRHLVAHSADAMTLTRGDLSEGVKFLRVLGSVLDQELAAHVMSMVGA